MFRVILSLTALVYGVLSISITTGPSDTAQTIGSKFTLKCTVAGRTDSDAVIWRMYNKTSGIPQTLTLDTIEKNPDQYTLETGGYNLVVKKATTDDDTVFECEAGESKAARVYIYDEPDSITLDWEHSVNKAGAVSANQEYKLRCKTTNSYPPATHRYYKDGVELSNQTIVYTYNNNTETGYGDVTSFMPFTPTSSDVDGNINVRCEADLYIKKNVMSVSFGINGSPKTHTLGLGALLAMVASFLISQH